MNHDHEFTGFECPACGEIVRVLAEHHHGTVNGQLIRVHPHPVETEL